MKIKLQVSILFICIGVIASSVIGMTAIPETSIVSLVVSGQTNIIKNEPYFELVDMGDYVLLPLNALSLLLEFNLNFDREQNIVTISSSRFQREVEIHLDDLTYQVGDKVEWGSQPPLALNGDFYISPMVLEYVAQVKITWDFQNQELIIKGEWFPEKTLNRRSSAKTKDILSEDPEIKPLEGPDFSIGTIEYQLRMENHQDSSGVQSLTNILGLRGDGRAGPWSLSLGADFGELSEPSLTLIKVKYNLNNQLIVIGDSEVCLEETLGLKDIRGILYQFPENQIDQKLYVWTKVTGEASPGDQVQLFVNDQIVSEVTIREGNSYQFMNVPLKPRRINFIRVVIEKPSGECIETTKKVLASPRLIDRGANQYLLAGGAYHQSGLATSEGDMIAIRSKNGLTEGVSLNCEFVTFRPDNFFQAAQPVIHGGDLGIGLRINPSLIYSLDWLFGGTETEDPYQSGWKSSLLYGADHGCFEVTAFNTPAEITNGLRNVTPGRGITLNHELEFGKNMDFRVSGSLVESLPETFSKSMNAYSAYLGHHSDPQAAFQTVTSAMVKQQMINFQSEGVFSSEKQTGLILEYAGNTKGFSTKNQLEVFNADITKDSAPLNQKSVALKSTIIKSIHDSLLFGLTLNPQELCNNNEINAVNLNAQTTLKWNNQNLWLSMNYLVDEKLDPNLNSGLKLMKEESSWGIKYYFGKTASLYFNSASKTDNYNYSYTKNDFGGSLDWPQNESRLWLDLGYISPLAADSQPQWTYSFGFQKVFKSGLELSLETERLYDNINSSYQDGARLTLSQAIGFGPGRVRTMKYSSLENLSFISGTVYLDENGNAQKDPGERGVPGVKIALEGRVAETNESGVYIFNQVDPGVYRLNFSMKSLPADYTPNTPEQLLMIKQSENQFVDFGVTINGSISGKVFLDTNANGKQDEGEEGLSWIGISLDSNQKSFTSQAGTFYFENIPLGAHTISIIPGTVPTTMQAPDGEYQVMITEQRLDSQEILIPIVYKFIE